MIEGKEELNERRGRRMCEVAHLLYCGFPFLVLHTPLCGTAEKDENTKNCRVDQSFIKGINEFLWII